MLWGFVWSLVRNVKGLLALNRNDPIQNPEVVDVWRLGNFAQRKAFRLTLADPKIKEHREQIGSIGDLGVREKITLSNLNSFQKRGGFVH